VTAGSRIGNPVLLSLVLAGVGAAALCGFVGVAPNRLLSGQPVALWQAAGPVYTAGVAGIGAALLALCAAPQTRATQLAAAAVATALLLLLLAALGHAAAALSRGAPPATRVSADAGFWILAICAGLAILDALQKAGWRIMAGALAGAALAAGFAALAGAGAFDALSLAKEYAARRGAFAAAIGRHLLLVAGAVGPAMLIGLPLGLAAARRPRLQAPLFAGLNLLQTIPSVALFGLLLVPLSAAAKAVPALAAAGVGGVGAAPAIIALVLYSLLPLVRNTAAGISGIDPSLLAAARGVGMTSRQIFWRIEMPLAAPVLLAGLRIITVQAVGLAVVAALIGAGGLGTFVFAGLGQYAVDLVLLGALPAILLALAANALFEVAAALLRRRWPR
jgi:osmoprotectant transport system permease protein